jgi:hypothetical protein
MSDTKNMRWVEDYATDAKTEANDTQATVNTDRPAANDADGWQQYRRWITKAPAPRGRRVGIDPSLYTWKGYRTWSEKIKRNWSDESDSE